MRLPDSTPLPSRFLRRRSLKAGSGARAARFVRLLTACHTPRRLFGLLLAGKCSLTPSICCRCPPSTAPAFTGVSSAFALAHRVTAA